MSVENDGLAKSLFRFALSDEMREAQQEKHPDQVVTDEQLAEARAKMAEAFGDPDMYGASE